MLIRFGAPACAVLLSALPSVSYAGSAPMPAAPPPPVVPPDTELIDPAAFGFGAPSLLLDSTWQSGLDYENRDGDLEMFELHAVAPFAKWKFGDTSLGATLDYSWRRMDFGDTFGLGRKDLHTIDLRLSAFWRRDGSPWWALGYVQPGLASDFESVDSDAFTLSGLALAGYTVNSRLDLAAGAYVGWGIGDTLALGAVGFIWRPTDQWIIQATPPVIAIGYKPVPEWTFSAVVYPAGEEWEIERSDRGIEQVELSLWRAALSAERRIGDRWRINVRGGIAFAGELELRDGDEIVLDDTDLDPAPFGAVAVKWVF